MCRWAGPCRHETSDSELFKQLQLHTARARCTLHGCVRRRVRPTALLARQRAPQTLGQTEQALLRGVMPNMRTSAARCSSCPALARAALLLPDGSVTCMTASGRAGGAAACAGAARWVRAHARPAARPLPALGAPAAGTRA
jgi:hypothetical protein